MKIIEVTDEHILFDNGYEIWSICFIFTNT